MRATFSGAEAFPAHTQVHVYQVTTYQFRSMTVGVGGAAW